jgi:hypothetical protein
MSNRDRRRALLLGIVAFFVYNSNLRAIATGDSLPARFLPFAILGHGTLGLEPVLEATSNGHANPYWIVGSLHGRRLSMYPIVAPVFVTPLYAPAAAVLALRGWNERELEIAGEIMEKIAASAVAAFAAALVFLLLRHRVDERMATLLALVFAFSTNTWATGSQALWQHGFGELLLAGALLALTSEPTVRHGVLAGICLGLTVPNRLPNTVLAAALLVYGVVWAGRRVPALLASAALSAAPFLLYNWVSFRELGGGYSYVVKKTLGSSAGFFANPLFSGLAGLLVSPGRGLLFFSPVFVFLGAILFRKVKLSARDRLLALCIAAGVVCQLALYAKTNWSGGYSYGPRTLTDMLPLLIWLLAPVVASLRETGRALFLAAALAGVVVQFVGVFCYPRGGSDFRGDVWRPSDAPVLIEGRAGFSPMTFLQYARKLGHSIRP